jgi:hypothetical protein
MPAIYAGGLYDSLLVYNNSIHMYQYFDMKLLFEYDSGFRQ